MRFKITGEVRECSYMPAAEKDGKQREGYHRIILDYDEPRVSKNGQLLADGVVETITLKHSADIPKVPIEMLVSVKPFWDGKSLDFHLEWYASKASPKKAAS